MHALLRRTSSLLLVAILLLSSCSATETKPKQTPHPVATFSMPEQGFAITYDKRMQFAVDPDYRGHWVLSLTWPKEDGTGLLTVDVGRLPSGQTASEYLDSTTAAPKRFARNNERRWLDRSGVAATTIRGPLLTTLNDQPAVLLETKLENPMPYRVVTFAVPAGKRLYEVTYGTAWGDWERLQEPLRLAAESFTTLPAPAK